MAKPPKSPPPTSPRDSLRGGRGLAVTVRSAGKRSVSSARWLTRQLNDPYVAAAKQAGWRSRAAFKLLELDERFHLLHRGQRVLDLGAAPGGWSQVALRAGAQVVGLDLLAIEPLKGAVFVQGDMDDPAMPRHLAALLGAPPDLVLSDMAPNTTGHAATDHLRIVGLAANAAAFAMEVLAPGGAFVCKVFQGGAEASLLAMLKQRFATVRHAKPPASRKASAELYVVAQGFR